MINNNLYRVEGELTPEDILNFIQDFQASKLPRYQKLKAYYMGQHEILSKLYEPYKPDAKLVHNFASYITDQATGYFMGNPITYTSDEDKLMEQIGEIFDYNDESDLNAIHAEQASIYGLSYELLYIDKTSMIDTRMAAINPEEMFLVYDYALEPNIKYAIRFYNGADNDLNVEVYTEKEVIYYEKAVAGLKLMAQVPHFFKEVPVNVFTNNNSLQGDFEPVITLIDEYNLLSSDTANDFAYFSDAYLFLSGAEIDEDTARNMKENRIINIADPQASATWLTKGIQDTALENFKNRLTEDIHKFSAIPNLTDEAFASNLSGVAIKYKLIGLENITKNKERKFKKGIQRRLELLFNLLYTRGLAENVNYLAIKPVFKRNLPANLMEEAEMVRNLHGLISTETLLTQLSIIEDAKEEADKLQAEKDEKNPFMNNAFATQATDNPTGDESNDDEKED